MNETTRESCERVAARLGFGASQGAVMISGSLSSMLEVYAGPTIDGPHQVHVALKTSDRDGLGRHGVVMDIDPATSGERMAAIVHELALSLLAHELLEQITDSAGTPIIDPHDSNGDRKYAPPLTDHHSASGHVGVTLVKPAEQSHNGACRLTDCAVEPGISEVVRRLNHPIFGDLPFTVAACEGHPDRCTHPSVTMADRSTMTFAPPSTHRGHRIEISDGPWVYSDTRELVSENPDRACGHCGLPNTPEGHDGCLGTIVGAMNACCGHGDVSAAYVQIGDIPSAQVTSRNATALATVHGS